MKQVKIEPQREFTLSKNTDRALAEIIGTINELRKVYEDENTALQACDTKRFLSLNARKLQAVSDYKACVRQVVQRRAEFSRVHPEIRTRLLALETDFTELATRNLELLSRLNKSVQRLGARLKRAAIDAVQKKSVNYSASGNLTRVERPVSIGINQSA